MASEKPLGCSSKTPKTQRSLITSVLVDRQTARRCYTRSRPMMSAPFSARQARKELAAAMGTLPGVTVAPRRRPPGYELTEDDKSDAEALKCDGRERKDDLTIDDLRAWSRNLRKEQGQE